MIKIPLRRRQADIIPSGASHGLDPVLGLQERNQRNLLEIFSVAQPVIEEMAKIKPESWRNMRGLFTALESTFGTSQITAGALKPTSMFMNMGYNMLSGLLSPVMVGINNISNQVESFALQYQTGAVIGGVAGGLLGAYLGSPTLGALFGALVGAGLEALLVNPDPRDPPRYYPPDLDILKRFPADPIEEIANQTRNWMNYNAGFAPTLMPPSRGYLVNRYVGGEEGFETIGRQGGR